MPKYMMRFSYTPEAWTSMIHNPSDRTAAARAGLGPVGGTLECFYFTFGERDGLVICDVPDGEAAAAAAIAVNSSGAFRSVITEQLIEPTRMTDVLERSGQVLGGYAAPGS